MLIPDGTALDMGHLRQWMGRTQTDSDAIAAAPIAGLLATLDYDVVTPRPGDPIPPLRHWLYFQPTQRQSEIGPDGHPKRAGFLLSVPLPRRMWAASRIGFATPLHVGQLLSRISRIDDVQMKAGRTGALVFVNVRHEIYADNQLSITEEQDIVYRDMPPPGEPALVGVTAPDSESWSRQIERNDVYDVAPFLVCGRRQDAPSVKLCARTAEGHLAMDASATLA